MENNANVVFEYLNSIGTVGLAFIVWALTTGLYVTRREHNREIERNERLDQRLERALQNGDRAMNASDKLADRLPAAKN